MTLFGVLKKAALVAVVVSVVGCLPTEKTGAPEPIKRHLVYQQMVGEAGIWIADADGTRARLLVRDGQFPVVSPDGKLVAYFADCRASNLGCTYVVSTSGGKPRLVTTRKLDEAITWSPTSEKIASISAFGGRGSQQGDEEDELVSVDVVSGEEVTLARAAQFFGWTFSPNGENVVFARTRRTAEGYISENIDLFVTTADGGETRRITETGDSSYPAWGPTSIAFAKYNPLQNKGRPSEIWQIQPDGTGRTNITKRLPKRFVGHGHVGLVPIDWSADGSALLAGLVGNSGTEPIGVDPETGTARELGRFGRRWGTDTIALSRDGRSVLIQDGSFAEVPPEKMEVLIVPYRGGKPTLAARGARAPSWNR
jgi:dipeptidyl aminopeptidase/acylaminoacyl peptidase